MQVVIPMAGDGARFVRGGYRDIKPLVAVDGRPMIEHAIGLFPGVTDFIFVCSREHLAETPLEAVLRNAAPTSRIVPIESHNLGPVHSVLQAESVIQPNEPVIVSYCDFSTDWNFADFQEMVAASGCEGAMTAWRGFHPHSLGPNLHTYLRQRNQKLLETRDKHSFTNERTREYAAAGMYYFRSGTLLKHYFHKTVSHGLTTTGEYSAGAACALMVQDGLTVSVHELQKFADWGTPEDLDEYNGWSEYFSRWADWRPARPTAHTTLLPMAGGEEREAPALTDVGGVPIIARVLNTIPASAQTMAMCRAEHLKNTPLSRVLRAARPGVRTIPFSQKTEGDACLCLMPDAALDSRRPVLIARPDASLVYDEYALAALTCNTDCVVFTFRDHAHANRNPEQYNWVGVTADGAVEEVRIQAEPAGDIRSARGITGMFWFREAGVMFDAVRHWAESGRRSTDAFDLSLILERLVETGYSVRALDVRHYISFARPDAWRTWEYWEAWFHDRSCTDAVPEAVDVSRAAFV